MKFLIYPNVTYPQAVAFADSLTEQLRADGHAAVRYESGVPVTEKLDMLLVVGGDGTVIRAVRELYTMDLPVWAVNLGHLGYLTECDVGESPKAIRQILSGDYSLQSRVLLSGQVDNGSGQEELLCLNDVSIHRGGFSHMLRMELFINDTSIMRFSGDGIIVSTPTGSTAYNLSAGGPILLPDSDQLVVTPICPHAAVCPPVVVPAGYRVSVRIDYTADTDEDQLPSMTLDGIQRSRLIPGSVVSLCTGDRRVHFVKTNHDSFYERLRQKMAGQ